MRFKSSYTRDVAGVFDRAGSFLNGSAAFEDAMDLAGLGETDNSTQETILRLRAMKAAESGNLKRVNAIQRKLLTLNAGRQSRERTLSLGTRSRMDNSELKMNARIEAWNNPAANQRHLDVMRRNILQDQTVSQDALVKVQQERLQQRFQEMPIVDLGPLRFSQGNQVASIFQSLNGLDEETILSVAQAVGIANAQRSRLNAQKRMVVKKELMRIAKTRGKNPSYFIRRYGSSFQPLDGLDGNVTEINAQTVSMDVIDLQQLLLDNGADPTRLVSSKTGRPDGVGGETTQIRAQEIGHKLGFEMVRLEYFNSNKGVRVTPSGFVKAMQGATPAAPASEAKPVRVKTKQLQEVLLKLGSPSAGIVNKKTGKPDGAFGGGTARALSTQAAANKLPVSSAKRDGTYTVIAPDTTWLVLKKLADSKPVDMGSASETVDSKDVQAVLIILGAPKDGLISKKTGQPDGNFGSRSKAAFRDVAAMLGLPVVMLDTKSGRKKTVIKPATTWYELSKRASAAQAAAGSSATSTMPGRTYASATSVSSLQQWLLNLGAPKNGLLSTKTGKPDGAWGSKTEKALKQVSAGMGYRDIAYRLTKNKTMIMLSPPELQSALIEGTSGRMTTTVETSEDTQIKQAKSEIQTSSTRQELAKKAAMAVNAYISKNKKPPKIKLNEVKSYQKTAKLKGTNGKYGPETRAAIAKDLMVEESSLPVSAWDKPAPGPSKSTDKRAQLTNRAQAAVRSVKEYILANNGRPPRIKLSDVDSFQRAFKRNGPDGATKRKLGIDSKWGPTTREAASAILDMKVSELPISAYDKGAPKIDQESVSDEAQSKVEQDKIDSQRKQDEVNGGKKLPDEGKGGDEMTTTGGSTDTATTSDTTSSDDSSSSDEETPWYKKPVYLIGGGIGLAILAKMAFGKKSASGLPARA